jgi:hypothetical protein
MELATSLSIGYATPMTVSNSRSMNNRGSEAEFMHWYAV